MDPGVGKDRGLYCEIFLNLLRKKYYAEKNGIFIQQKKSKLDAKCIMICFLSTGR
jgi:hypothetical protein